MVVKEHLPSDDVINTRTFAAVAASLSGCDVLRVHDVAATREALLIALACRGTS